LNHSQHRRFASINRSQSSIEFPISLPASIKATLGASNGDRLQRLFKPQALLLEMVGCGSYFF
jgi:hypothetical protein